MSSNLFDRRLLFVVGKGGVGKTTISAALGIAAVERGKRVLIVELESEDRLLPLLGKPAAEKPDPIEIRPGLYRMSIGGRAALEEYLSMIIPIRRVLRAVFDSRLYQYFVAAAPGLKELMTVGKIWFEVDQGRWDLVIVDCPATGHSLQYLRMPKAAYETFTSGLVHREAKRVWELLCDSRRTGIVVVTLAEEMPVNETLEIFAQLENELGFRGERLVINRFLRTDLSRSELSDREPGPGRPPEEVALVEAVLTRAAERVSWSERNESHRARLEASGRPCLVLPFLFREEFGLPDVGTLATHLMEGLGAGTDPRAKRGRA